MYFCSHTESRSKKRLTRTCRENPRTPRRLLPSHPNLILNILKMFLLASVSPDSGTKKTENCFQKVLVLVERNYCYSAVFRSICRNNLSCLNFAKRIKIKKKSSPHSSNFPSYKLLWCKATLGSLCWELFSYWHISARPIKTLGAGFMWWWIEV